MAQRKSGEQNVHNGSFTLLYQRRFATRAQARAAITEWIEVFYNRQRLHSALGYQSLVAFRQGLL